MRIQEDIKSVTCMKDQASELLRAVSETRRPVVITQDGKPKGVLLDVASYQALTDTSLMLKLINLSEGEEKAGELVSQDEVFAEKPGGVSPHPRACISRKNSPDDEGA